MRSKRSNTYSGPNGKPEDVIYLECCLRQTLTLKIGYVHVSRCIWAWRRRPRRPAACRPRSAAAAATVAAPAAIEPLRRALSAAARAQRSSGFHQKSHGAHSHCTGAMWLSGMHWSCITRRPPQSASRQPRAAARVVDIAVQSGGRGASRTARPPARTGTRSEDGATGWPGGSPDCAGSRLPTPSRGHVQQLQHVQQMLFSVFICSLHNLLWNFIRVGLRAADVSYILGVGAIAILERTENAVRHIKHA